MKMTSRYKELSKEWDRKNNKGKLKDYTEGSHSKVWWVCKKNPCGCHRWEAVIKSRYQGNNCPFCSNRKICEHNNFAYTQPKILEEWDYDNNDIDPETISSKSGYKAWWVCRDNPCGCHRWQAKVADRTNNKSNCPFCTKGIRRSCPHNNLLVKFPDLCKEWDYKRNKSKPEDYSPYSKYSAWWICRKNPCGCHRWRALINTRTNSGNNCGYCCNQLICPHNNLLAKRPDICEEWDYDKNKISPESVPAGTTKKAWWICKNNQLHKWRASISCRNRGTDCPKCSISKGEKAIQNYLEKRSITFVPQKRFRDCRRIHLLRFDFYLPDHNILIEYDGQQHFDPNTYLGKLADFNVTIEKDELKTVYALKNRIFILRISYEEKEADIPSILDHVLSTYGENLFLYDVKGLCSKDIRHHYELQFEFAACSLETPEV
jgi:very-short-patch-repair endonuclease